MLAIMGASGSGKSTLLKMMGAVYVNSQDLSKFKDIDGFRSKTGGWPSLALW